MKADPCLNFRACGSLNWRADTDLQPDRCPTCGGELLAPPRRRAPGLDDLVALARSGDDASYMAAVKALARADDDWS